MFGILKNTNCRNTRMRSKEARRTFRPALKVPRIWIALPWRPDHLVEPDHRVRAVVHARGQLVLVHRHHWQVGGHWWDCDPSAWGGRRMDRRGCVLTIMVPIWHLESHVFLSGESWIQFNPDFHHISLLQQCFYQTLPNKLTLQVKKKVKQERSTQKKQDCHFIDRKGTSRGSSISNTNL